MPTLVDLRERHGIDDVVVDRGYTQLASEKFYFPVRRAGINITMDLTEKQRGRRPFRTDDLLLDGQLYSRHTPAEIQGVVGEDGYVGPFPRPPRGCPSEELLRYTMPFELRARWRMSRHAGPDYEGSTRWRCPFCLGRLKSRAFPKTLRSPHHVPLVDASGDRCCDGTVTVTAPEIPLWQPYSFGTRVWHAAYGRRNLAETVNSSLKAQFKNFGSKGTFQVFTLTKVTLLVGCAIVGLNLDRSRSWQRRQALLAGQPKRRIPSRPRRGTWTALLGHSAAGEPGDFGRDPP